MANEDRPLLDRAVTGDADALSSLLKKHASRVRASICGQIPAKWQSVLSEDDVMQQTYADAFTDIEYFDPDEDGSFSGWLCRLAQCNLRDALRMFKAVKRGGRINRVEFDDNAKSAVALVEMLTASGTSPSRYAAGREAKTLLDHALDRLPPNYRLVVRMFDLEGHDVEVIARRLERSCGAVYMLRARAHDRLRRLLGATSNFFTDGA